MREEVEELEARLGMRLTGLEDGVEKLRAGLEGVFEELGGRLGAMDEAVEEVAGMVDEVGRRQDRVLKYVRSEIGGVGGSVTTGVDMMRRLVQEVRGEVSQE